MPQPPAVERVSASAYRRRNPRPTGHLFASIDFAAVQSCVAESQ
nr:hypothetical protein [Kibdelosporangium sp. MJ126-NF4]